MCFFKIHQQTPPLLLLCIFSKDVFTVCVFSFFSFSRFKAKLWLCESHPLSLAEQVVPIIDLMAISNALFAKLRDFITLRLPPGFPVKIGEGRERWM